MFLKLNSHLRSHHFENNDKVISAVEEFVEEQDATFFYDYTAMHEYRWTKYMNVKENYTEK